MKQGILKKAKAIHKKLEELKEKAANLDERIYNEFDIESDAMKVSHGLRESVQSSEDWADTLVKVLEDESE